MGGSSQKQTQQQQSTSTNTIDPTELAMLQGNYASAQSRANSLVPYTGQITAGFNPTQTQAQGVLTGIATDPSYGATNNSAIGSVQGILSANPNTAVTATPVTANAYNAATYDPSLLAGVDLTPYENPYTSDVINASITQNERARQTANVNDNQTATAAGAFGGSRSGVANALTNEAYDRNNQQNIASLNQANFAQAQAAAAGDVAAKNNAGQFNANSQNAASQANASAENSANQFNASQDLTAQQSSIADALAALGVKLNAAGQLVSMNNQALNTAATQGGILASVGDAQQQQEQTELTNAYNAYIQGQQLTVAQQNLLNSALGLIPNQQTVTSNQTGSSTTKSNPGLGGILGGIANIGLGVASLGTGSLGGSLLGGLFGDGLDYVGVSPNQF